MESKLTMALTGRNRLTIPDRPFVRKFAAGNGELKSTFKNGRESDTEKKGVLRVVFSKTASVRKAKNPVFPSQASQSAVQDTCETQIRRFEKDAQEKYLAAIRDMREVKLSDQFERLSAHQIIPALKRIGFDEALAWAIFKMAATAWELMGPLSNKNILFDPALTREMNEIRNGVIAEARKNTAASLKRAQMTPAELHESIQESMKPQHLPASLEDNSKSWITLPRVYNHLNKGHARCLPVYLKYLDKETDPAFKKILIRIIIEFVGNYTLKHISKEQSADRMSKILFYGYAAMYWKNLLNPPGVYEDCMIFDVLLHWTDIFQNKFVYVDCDMARTLESMKDEKERIFPVMNAFGTARNSPRESDSADRFLIALRHGGPGIETAVKHFGIGHNLLRDKTDGRLPYTEVPKALSALFRKIRTGYARETSATRKVIRKFLFRLKNTYDLKHNRCVRDAHGLSGKLRFAGPRIARMINDLNGSLQLK